MERSESKDVWAAGTLYEPYVGRWSRLVAMCFLCVFDVFVVLPYNYGGFIIDLPLFTREVSLGPMMGDIRLFRRQRRGELRRSYSGEIRLSPRFGGIINPYTGAFGGRNNAASRFRFCSLTKVYWHRKFAAGDPAAWQFATGVVLV